MIILDIETCGLDPVSNCMVSLGAIDYDTGDEFYRECCIYPTTVIDPQALGINGFTVDQIKDPSKKPAHYIYLEFVKWCKDHGQYTLAGQNVGVFDSRFLNHLDSKLPTKVWPFGHRTVDLHSVAFAKFRKSLTLDQILAELGLPTEPRPHNALTGAKLEYIAFRKLLG